MRNELMLRFLAATATAWSSKASCKNTAPPFSLLPLPRGFDRAAYILPFLALILGFGLVVMIVRS